MKCFSVVAFSLALAVLSPSMSAAEDEPAPSPYGQAVKSEELLFKDIPSVYTASKYEQKVTKAPASVSIVTADEIKKWGYRTFADILNSLKGFYTTTDRNYSYVGTRGFGLPTDYNTRLLLLIDGHRYNDNLFDAFYVQEDFPVDIDMVERVEVVRGPSSSLYGSNAFFGVVNVITKRGRDQNGANVKTTYGSNLTYKNSFSYGKRFGNGLETFLSGTHYDSQGDSRFYSREFDDPSTNNGIYQDNDKEESKRVLAKLSYQDFTLQGIYNERRKAVPTASFGTVFNDPRTQVRDQTAFVYLTYNHTFENQLNLEAKVSFNQYHYEGDFPFDSSENPATPNVLENLEYFDGQWWRANVEMSKVLFDDHRVTVGGEYQDNFQQYMASVNRSANDQLTDFQERNINGYRWAVYAQDEYTITDQLTFNAGLRYDFYNTFGSTLNPRMGLIYNPLPKTSFKLLYGTAFRAPNEYEINTPSPFVLASPDLKAETLETAEFIAEHYITDTLRGELNFFHTEVTDIISSVPSGQGDTLENRNVDDAVSNGFELQLEDNWGNGFQGRVSYSWQDTEYKRNSARLPNSPEHMVKLNLIAPLWQEKVFLGYELQYLSGRRVPAKDTGGVGEVGDYTVSNVTVFTRDWVKGLELSAGAYNLFDQRYFDPGSPDMRQVGVLRDGLTFRVRASVDF